MANICNCFKMTFNCDPTGSFQIEMTTVGLFNGYNLYYGNYSGQTYVVSYDGPEWIFYNINNTSQIIFQTPPAISPCSIKLWDKIDTTGFGTCSSYYGAASTSLYNSECADITIFSGDCQCYEITASVDAYTTYQTCQDNIFTTEMSTGDVITVCAKETPLLFSLNETYPYGTVSEYSDSTCDFYCNTGDSCCLLYTGVTSGYNGNTTVVTVIGSAYPVGTFNGKSLFSFNFNGYFNVSIFYDGASWVLQEIYDGYNVTQTNNSADCPIGLWVSENYESQFIFQFNTEQITCPTPPRPLEPIPYCLQGTNECSVVTLTEMIVGCQVTNPTSQTSSNGIASLLISGGTPPYTIIWNNFNIGQTIYGLTPGTYNATIVDYYGDFCAKTSCVLIAEIPPVPCELPFIKLLNQIEDSIGLSQTPIAGLDTPFNLGPRILTNLFSSGYTINNCGKTGNCNPDCEPYILTTSNLSIEYFETLSRYCLKMNCCFTFIQGVEFAFLWNSQIEDYYYFTAFDNIGELTGTTFGSVRVYTNCTGSTDILTCLSNIESLIGATNYNRLLKIGILESGLYGGTSIFCHLYDYFQDKNLPQNTVYQYILSFLFEGMFIDYNNTTPCNGIMYSQEYYYETLSSETQSCYICGCYFPISNVETTPICDKFVYYTVINNQPAWSGLTSGAIISYNALGYWELTPTNYFTTTTGVIVTSNSTNNPPDNWQVLGQTATFTVFESSYDMDCNEEYLKYAEAVGPF